MAIVLNSESGIQFSNVILPGATTGNKRTNSTYKDKLTGNDASARSTTEINEPTARFVNAIDIDWNGAIWPTLEPETPETINTTGDLINAIKWASTQGSPAQSWDEVSGGPDDDATLEAGESFVVPQVSQATNGQVTVTEKTFTLPQHTTTGENTQEFDKSIITGILLDQYGHVNTVKSEEIISIYWNDNGATTPHEGGSSFIIKGNKVILPTIYPSRKIKITWDYNGGRIPNWGDVIRDDFEYTFNGWYTSNGIQINNNTIPSTNITYFAQWTAPTSIELPEDSDDHNINITPVRNGYTFRGWATTSTATTPNVTENTVPSADVTYYAVWELNNPYWYQGADEPTNPNNSSENIGLNKWTSLDDSSNPTSIKFGVQDPKLDDHDWYFAVPAIWNFTKMSDVLGTTDLSTDSYEVTTKTISGIDYTVFHWLDETDAMYGTIQ